MKSTLRKAFVIIFLLSAVAARAEVPHELYNVDGKTFESKSEAIRYVINSGKRLQVLETRCLILTNKLTLKACPKNKQGTWENEQFAGLKVKQ